VSSGEATSYNHDAAVELAQAESICREWLPFSRDGEAVCWVMVEYDRRAAEIEELRARLRTAEEVEQGLVEKSAARGKAVEQLRAQRVQADDLARGARAAVVDLRAENERVRSQRAAALVLARQWVHGTTAGARSENPDVAVRARTLKSAATELRAVLGVEA
jgi:hypothetical protein